MMKVNKRRIISLVLVVVFSLCLCLSVYADTSKTVNFTNNKATQTVYGETKGGWWWWSNPTSTVTIKNNSSNRNQWLIVTVWSPIFSGGNKMFSIEAGKSVSVSLTGSAGQGVKYSVEIKPGGNCYVNNTWGSATVTASSGTIR